MSIAEYDCPSCGQGVVVNLPPETPLVRCEACGGEFYIQTPEVQAEQAAIDEAERQAAALRHEAELSLLRISNLSQARRASLRLRSWAVIGGICCAVAGAELGWSFANRLANRDPAAAAYGVAMLLAIWGVVHLFRAAGRLNAELRPPPSPPPVGEPDFTPLSDGSSRGSAFDELR